MTSETPPRERDVRARLSLRSLLVADLERQYFYDGTPARPPSIGGVIRRLTNPRFAPVVLFRLSHALYGKGWYVLSRLTSAANFVLFGVEIAMRCEVGPGLYFPHTAGIVVGAARIGRNALIYNGVTIGAREMDIAYTDEVRPTIGDDVMIGSGAKVLGAIEIGDGAKIGANAVVTKSVPARSVVVGIPARVIREEGETAR
jgi:serine O-acetyltransferase